MMRFYPEILPPILLNLQSIKIEDNESDSSPYAASVNTLYKMNKCLGDTIIMLYTEFIDSSFG